MSTSIVEKAKMFATNVAVKNEMDNALTKLKLFREKYPFTENPESIETLKLDDIFKYNPSQVGDFFRWLEYHLYTIGHLTLHGSNVYRQIRSQLEEFKALLYVVVDKEKSIAEKVDAPWNEIRGLGGDRHIAKKIIFCFNFETDEILPIFSTKHLEYFLGSIVERPEYPPNYESLTLGEKYKVLNSEILKVKREFPETELWEIPYFARFLYDTYPPPRIKSSGGRTILKARAKMEQQQQYRNFINLLNELKSKAKISAEEFRNYRKLWENNPEGRQSLRDQLMTLQNG